MDKKLSDKGIAIRAEVLGGKYPAKAIKDYDPFLQPFQEFTTAVCWGETWGRDDLSRKTRSLINIALLTALGREHELKLHLVGALRNGCTEEEIQGVLLHCCVYCGVAAGSAAFRTANEVIKEYRAENP
jgi:4-carboxymuconolactone decarboxylase